MAAILSGTQINLVFSQATCLNLTLKPCDMFHDDNNNNFNINTFLKSYKNYIQKFSKIFIKRKRPYQYKFPSKPLHNSKFQEIT